MKNLLTKLNTEKKNAWDFTSFITESASAAFIAKFATSEPRFEYRILFAIIAAVLVTNVLAKLYGLIRNK